MERSDLDAPLRILTVIWIAFTGGVLSVGVGAYALLSTGTLDLAVLEPSLVRLMAPVLLVMMAGALLVGRRLEAAIPRDATSGEKTQRYATARTIAMAGQEGPALAIIVLSALAGTRSWVVAAAAVGVWTIFLARPRREDLEALLRS